MNPGDLVYYLPVVPLLMTAAVLLVTLLQRAGRDDRAEARRERWTNEAAAAGWQVQPKPDEIWGVRLPAFSIEAFTGWVPDFVHWGLWLEKKEKGRWSVCAEYAFAQSRGDYSPSARGILVVWQLEQAVKPFVWREGARTVECDGEWLGVWTPAGTSSQASFGEMQAAARAVAARALEANAGVLQPV